MPPDRYTRTRPLNKSSITPSRRLSVDESSSLTARTASPQALSEATNLRWASSDGNGTGIALSSVELMVARLDVCLAFARNMPSPGDAT